MNLKVSQKQIFHHYEMWEDWKHGFYDNCSGEEANKKAQLVKEMFNSEALTRQYMTKVINEWIYSCEHNFTNNSMNKIAYLGQAACCLYGGVPNLITMNTWKYLDQEVRLRSDDIASQIILKWIQKKKSENILLSGKKRDTKTAYQTRLHLN